MSGPGKPEDPEGGVHLEAVASGQAAVNQAGRDLHLHFGAGVRRAVPTVGGADGGCPYPGLAPFTAEQAGWFFGRDRLTADLVGRMDGCLTGTGPVMVVAASGAGKSSLLRAGLLPRVAAGGLTSAGSRHWPRVVFTPGAHPLREAAVAVAAARPDADVSVPPDPGAEDLDILLARAVGAAGPGARAVLVVDQFEELFRLCDSEDERGAFISWLWKTARGEAPGGPTALAACAVRADFYPDCTRYPQLRQALQGNQVIVGAMSAEELRQAIACPAEAAGLDIEPGLIELLLSDLRAGHPAATGSGGLAADDGAGRLPLLAHALRATWQQRHGSTLTVKGYRSAGGIEHAIADSAERVFTRLDADAQQDARALFLRLVKIGDTSGEDVRRPVTRHGLTDDSGAAGAVIDSYTASRLLTQSRDAVQITHEALLRAWPRLAGWLSEDRAGQLMRQRIEDDAADWDRARRDPSLLYRGTRMQAAAAWADGHVVGLTVPARQFLAASRRRARRTGILQRSLIAVLAVLALATTITSVVALQQQSAAIGQRDLATQQRDLAVYNQVLAEANQLTGTDPAAAAQLLLTAYRIRPSADLQSRLISTENQPLPGFIPTSNAVTSVAVTPNGRVTAIAEAGTVSLWNTADPARPAELGQPVTPDGGVLVDSVALSPDGHLLATGDADGTITLWNTTTPAHPGELGNPLTPPGSGDVGAVSFSPDGRTLASIDFSSNPSDSGVMLWNISSPSHPLELGRPLIPHDGSAAQLAAFSPNGRTLATINYASNGRGSITLWDVSNPQNAHGNSARAAPATPSRVRWPSAPMAAFLPTAATTAPSPCGTSPGQHTRSCCPRDYPQVAAG
nr:AAA family ATPase [Trebonia sp.]